MLALNHARILHYTKNPGRVLELVLDKRNVYFGTAR